MIFRFNEDTGYVSVDLSGEGHPVRLRRPKIRQWADWHQHAAALHKRVVDAYAHVPAVDLPRVLDEISLAGPVASLLWEMISTLAAERIEWDPTFAVPLSHLSYADQLLAFWWECPLAPCELDGAKASTEDEMERAPRPRFDRQKKREARKISTDLPGAMGLMSVIYQSLATIGMGSGFTPPDIDRMEIWQVAILMGRDGSAVESMEQGGTVRHRDDGQVDAIGFTRDPDQPLLFTPGSNPKAALAWLKQKRERWRRQMAREGATGQPRRRLRRRTWRR